MTKFSCRFVQLVLWLLAVCEHRTEVEKSPRDPQKRGITFKRSPCLQDEAMRPQGTGSLKAVAAARLAQRPRRLVTQCTHVTLPRAERGDGLAKGQLRNSSAACTVVTSAAAAAAQSAVDVSRCRIG